MTIEEKRIALDKIAQEIKDFKGLAIAMGANHPVPGEGNPDSPLLLIGEAPGQVEDSTGRPFVGQSGSMMVKVMEETLNLKRKDVFITNIVKYRPPDNRDPFDNEIEACREWLDKQIAIISPKIIVTLGRFSMAKFIPGVTISRVHGQPRYVDFAGNRYTVFPMFHPAAALRGTGTMNEFKADFVKLKSLLEGEKPAIMTPTITRASEPEQASLF